MADMYSRAQAQNLITLLAHDTTHGKTIASLIHPDWFEGELRVVAERLVRYWKEYKKAPGDHTSDLFSDILEDKDNHKRETFRRIIRNMVALSEGINSKYVIDTARKKERVYRFQAGIMKAAELLNRQEFDLDEASSVIADLNRAREFNLDAGIGLGDVDQVFDYLETQHSEFRTGIRPFDHGSVVPARGTVMMVLAPSGRGKTWFLVNIGKHGLLQRKKVLHISLEMDRRSVIPRYWQALWSGAKRYDKYPVQLLNLDDEGRLVEMGKRKLVAPRFTLDKAGRKFVKNELRIWTRRYKLMDNLRVVSLPPRSLSMGGLRAMLDAFEATGFIPDEVILDYIGITKTDEKNYRISLGRSMEDYRAVMVERNMAGITAQQVGRAAMSATTVKSAHVAEDVSLISTCDTAVTYSQTDAERMVGLARMFVDKCRSEKDRWGVILTQSYNLGQFALDSAFLDAKYWKYFNTLPPDQHDSDDDE